MLYASPIDSKLKPINVRAEVEAIQEAFDDSGSTVKLHVGVATAESLTKVLTLARSRKGLVLHLSVHAINDKEKGLGLVLEDSRGRPHILWRSSLEEILGGPESYGQCPSLVFLSACWSQEVAQVFVEYGCKHVVSLATQVHDVAAIKFAQHFYMSLAVRTPLLAAWERARRALRITSERNLAEQADYFLLFGQQGADKATLSSLCGRDAQSDDGTPESFGVPSDLAYCMKEFEDADVFLDAKVPPRPQDFIGRTDDMIKILNIMHSRRACVVHGPGGIGKSALGLEVAHFAAAPGRYFSCSARIVRFEVASAASAINSLEDTIDSLAGELHVQTRLWSGHSGCPSSARSTATSSVCGDCAFPINPIEDSPTGSASDPLAPFLPAVQRMRRALQQVEKARRSARILLVIDDVAGVVSSSPEVHRALGELIDHTYRFHVLVCSREPIYQNFGNTKAVNLPLSGLSEKEAALLLLHRVHRPLGPQDFAASDEARRSGESPPPTTRDETLGQLQRHPLVKALAGNPGAVRAVGAQVHEGGPSLSELAARITADGPVGGVGATCRIDAQIGSIPAPSPLGSVGGP